MTVVGEKLILQIISSLYFATLAYSFKNRYVINANVRNDASNRFGQDTNHRIDPTYSFGFSWRASEERFMRKYVGWITNFKLPRHLWYSGKCTHTS